MYWNDFELFNVEETELKGNGIKFYRFPKKLMNSIGDSYFNRYIARTTTGCEIRFCGEACLTLSAIDEDGFVEIYRGDFYVSKLALKKGVETSVHLQYGQKIDNYPVKCQSFFSNDVWRIVFAHDFCGMICDVDKYSAVNPPQDHQSLKSTVLAYGSSITHGANSNLYTLSYLAQTGFLLGTQMLNKGMGGSCLCEKEMGDYIASSSCDRILLELGVNMMDNYSADEFYDRASYVVKSALSTDKKTALISPYMHFRDISCSQSERKISDDYLKACMQIADENKDIIFICGREILSDIAWLSADLIHPSMLGHSMIAQRLAYELKQKGFIN